MNTVHIGKQHVERLRRRFVKTFTNARISRVSFGDLAVKKLPILDFIDFYNHFMNGIDVIDQFRCYYDTQRVHLKIWKSLWHFLLDTTIVNSYKIINITKLRPYAKLRKHDSHRLFRMELIQKLYDYFERIAKSFSGFQVHDHKRKKLTQLIKHASAAEYDILVQLSEKMHYCVPCQLNNRIARKKSVRKFLQHLSTNSIRVEQRRQRLAKSGLSCELCRMFICKKISCWNEHLKACIVSN